MSRFACSLALGPVLLVAGLILPAPVAAQPSGPAPDTKPPAPLLPAPEAAPAPQNPAGAQPGPAPGGKTSDPFVETAGQAKSGAGETAPTAVPTDSADWALRDSVLNEGSTLGGASGLLRTQHAQASAPGQFRLGFTTEWFSAGFLCTPQFPCPNPTGGAPLTSDTVSHIGGTLSLGVSVAKLGPGTLEGYAAVVAYANSDSANRPALLQVLGDTDFGVKYMAPLGDVMHVGGFMELWLINGSGSVGLDSGGTGARFGAVATADLRGMRSSVPLRFSTNIVYVLDNTADVLVDVENARHSHVTRIERFGLGVNRVDHYDFLLGGEALLAEGRVRPFVEGRVQAASNYRQNFVCTPNNPSHDHCLATDTVVPSTLTLGGRFFPWKRGFSLLAALDIGLGGTSDFIEELQPVPPWTLFLGAGWAVDTWEHPPIVKAERVADVVSPNVHVVGFVHEKDKNDPVVGAVVAYRDHSELSRLATGPDGKFGDDVPPGNYTFEITADGYKPAVCEVAASSVAAAGGSRAVPPPSDPGQPVREVRTRAQVDVDCPMESLPRLGTVVGRVRDADTNQALPGIRVTMTDAQHKDLTGASYASGGFRFEGVSPGTAQLSVVAEGYLALVTPEDVKARQESSVDLLLRPKPKDPEVQVTTKEITIRHQIQFALDSAVILPESFGILTEVADTLIRHPEILRIEVQGHTDNSGTPEHNRQLSEERSESVRGWLVQHGVGPDRMLAKGYGQTRPLVPNVTAANRGKNRRVQFIILDREGSAAPAAKERSVPTGGQLPGF
ncbi:MAG TPA: OmpA family protein [Polyangiaceae bacterium]|nr:OmpA family protein [Polyangiaceae bacterium]